MVTSDGAGLQPSFSCWAAASSKVQPLAIDCATAPLTPAPSSSVRDARKIACGVRKRSSSLPDILEPRPGNEFQSQPVEFLFPAEDGGLHATSGFDHHRNTDRSKAARGLEPL